MMDVSRIGTSQFKTTTSPFNSYSSAFQKNSVTILPTRIPSAELYKSPKSPSQDKSSSYESCGSIEHYKIIRAFSNKHTNPVYLAQIDGHKSDNDSGSSLRVIKTLDLNDQSFVMEASILSLPSHSNVIECKEILTSAAIELNFDVRIQNAIVLEHAANGDLFPYMECGALSEPICRYYFEQMLNAIEYLHENGYCHLDIKPENLLLDERFNLKLCDFGYAAKFEKNSKLVRTPCGTSSYCAPEAWKSAAKEKGYDGTKADIYQLGIMLFIMLTGQPPFSKSKIEDGWFALVARGRWDEFWDFKENGITKVSSVGDKPIFSPAVRELLRSMFEPQPNMRTTIQSIRKSAWFTETFPAESIEVQFEMLNRKAMKKL